MTRVRAIYDDNSLMSTTKTGKKPRPIGVMTVLTVTMTQTAEDGSAEIVLSDGYDRHFVAPLNADACKSLMIALLQAISKGAKS